MSNLENLAVGCRSSGIIMSMSPTWLFVQFCFVFLVLAVVSALYPEMLQRVGFLVLVYVVIVLMKYFKLY